MRCIKTNEQQLPGIFDRNFVDAQLKSASIIAYTTFIRCGYSIRLELSKLDGMFTHNFDDFGQYNKKEFYSLLAAAIGLRSDDYKFGQNSMFFRRNKSPYFCHLVSDSNQHTTSILTHKIKKFQHISKKWQHLRNMLFSFKGMW